MTAQTFPAPLADFISPLKIKSLQLSLPVVQEVSRGADGAIYTSSLGARLWRGSVTLSIQSRHDADAALARIRLMGGVGASFLMSPVGHATPASDPARTGSAMAITLNTVSSDAREVTLGGFTSGFAMSAGDYISFLYNGLYAFHQITADAVADGTGALGPVEVIPAIRPGWTAATPVTIYDPVFKAVMDSTATEGEAQRVTLDGISVPFLQVLR